MRRVGAFVSMGMERNLAELVDVARAFDEAGADSLWVAEDYGKSDAFVQLGALAAVTKRAQLGIGVSHPYTRNPALLAMSCATVDRLSGGRLILGLGRNARAIIEGQLGIPYGRPLAIMDELAMLVRAMWAGDAASSNGYFHVKDLILEVPPPRPRIPIYLGVSGPKGLRQAGRMADGVLLVGFQTPQCVRWTVDQIHRGAADAGRDPAAVDVAMILWGFQVADDPSQRIAALKPMLAFLLGLPSYYETLLTQGGLDPGILKPLREALKVEEILAQGKEPYQHMMTMGDLGKAVSFISDDMMRAMCVLGSEAECRRRLDEYKRAGLSHLVLNHGMLYGMPIGQDLRTSLGYLERLRNWWSN
jgi:5,10-methylenetetrahydromethanopterin reductase